MQQFKIGDWVKYDGEFYRVHEEYNGKGNISKEVVNSLVRHDKNVQLWQPKEGEWVVCTISSIENMFSVFKYEEELYNEIKEMNPADDVIIQPFIGELPSFLKDNQ